MVIGWENLLLDLGSERVNPFTPKILKVNSPNQGLKLTVLCRRQVATEIFFSVAKWKIWLPKSGS